MNLATLCVQWKEQEMKLKRLVEEEKGDKNKKNLALKVEEDNDSDIDEEMIFLA